MKTDKGFSRKKFFIDSQLQVRYMITLLIPMLIMLAFMLLTLYLASQTIITTSSKIMRREIDTIMAIETQDKPPEFVDQYKTIMAPIDSKLRDFGSDSGDIRREFAGTLMGVFGAGILLVVLQVVMMSIFFSHKMAGPVYRFEKMCKSIINGDYTDVIYLRKGDQMQNLAALLNEATKTTRKRIMDLEAKIAELEHGKQNENANA